MKYITRPGVTPAKICGITFLLSTREASEHCPLITRPGLFELMSWEGTSKGKTKEELCSITERAFKRTPEQAELIIGNAFRSLVEKGYLIEEDE